MQAEGIQYLLLLHIRGYPGRGGAKVGELAERLQAQQHGLIIGMIARSGSEQILCATPRRGVGARNFPSLMSHMK